MARAMLDCARLRSRPFRKAPAGRLGRCTKPLYGNGKRENKIMLARHGHQTFWHGQGDGQELVICKLFNNFNHIWRTTSPPKAYARVRCRSNKPEKRELFAEQCARGTKHISPQRSR